MWFCTAYIVDEVITFFKHIFPQNIKCEKATVQQTNYLFIPFGTSVLPSKNWKIGEHRLLPPKQATIWALENFTAPWRVRIHTFLRV